MHHVLFVVLSCYLRLISTSEVQERFEVNPNATLTVPELIEQSGYPVEVHHVTTKDGYMLEMHRIPGGLQAGPAKGKPVAFIMHGLLCSSADWIIAGPERGLAYLLADQGYDVWLGNARGNKYSRKHTTLNPSQSDFWDFSWHEIGVEDLPAMIDYTLAKSGQKKIFYIGHSQGTTSFYVMCSQKPEYNNKIRAMFSLAPVAYMTHVRTPFFQFASATKLNILLNLIGFQEFLPSNKLMTDIAAIFCTNSSIVQKICTNVLFLISGFDQEELDTDLLPVIMAHTPAGSSSKQIAHYVQEVASGKFRMYDYEIGNVFRYFNDKPPSYKLSKVTAPVHLHYSSNDWLAAIVDVEKLASELGNMVGLHLVKHPKFNHMDFLWGKHVKEMLYDDIFKLMSGYQ